MSPLVIVLFVLTIAACCGVAVFEGRLYRRHRMEQFKCFTKIELVVKPGANIEEVVTEAIGLARHAHDTLIVFDFGGVHIQVRGDSEPATIVRDYRRMSRDSISPVVWPYSID